MPGNLIGERFVTMSFGESHGTCIGAVIDGCPAGMPLSESDIQKELEKRRPGQSAEPLKGWNQTKFLSFLEYLII